MAKALAEFAGRTDYKNGTIPSDWNCKDFDIRMKSHDGLVRVEITRFFDDKPADVTEYYYGTLEHAREAAMRRVMKPTK